MKKGDSVDFNGWCNSIQKNGFHVISQTEKLWKLCVPSTRDELVCTRAQIQCIGTCTRPDLCAAVQLLASSVDKTAPQKFKEIRKFVEWCHTSATVGTTFFPVKLEKARFSLFTDASFANADRFKSQMGFVLVIGDGENSNIIHYGSSRCRRVTRSVMAAELHALFYGFDSAYVARDILHELRGRKLDIDGYVDSRTVFNVVAKNSSTLEKRLQIDVHELRESHRKGELRYLAWIPSKQNVAYGVTKGLIDAKHPLGNLMTKNRLDIQPQGCVDGTGVGDCGGPAQYKHKHFQREKL